MKTEMIESCATCNWGHMGGKCMWPTDIFCTNDQSDACTEYVTPDDYCG